MTTNRITNTHLTDQFLSNLHRITGRQSDLQDQLSSGKRINSPDDDAFGTKQVIDFDGQLQDNEQFSRTVSDALGLLGTQDGALSNVYNALQSIRDKVVQAAHGGSLNQNDLNSIAAEVAQLKEVVRDGANAQYGAVYVFSGTATNTSPYPFPGNGFVGTNNLMQRRVAPGLTMNVNLDGPTIFGTTTGATPNLMNTFDLIDQIVADMQTGTPASLGQLGTADLQALDSQISNLTNQQAVIGSAEQRLQVIQGQLADMKTRLSDARSKVADADMAQTYMDYTTQATLYQSALAAGSRIMQTSLLDFL